MAITINRVRPAGTEGWLWAAQAVLVLAVFATAAFGDSGAGEVSGRVLDAGHHASLAGVAVSIPDLGLRSASGEDGSFLLEGVAPGIHRLVVEKDRFAVQLRVVSVPPGGRAAVEIALYPLPEFGEEILVIAPGDGIEDGVIRRSDLSRQTTQDTGAFLRSIPGGGAVRRGGTALDPVIRGFQQDRVTTVFNGVVGMEAACPNRMDPPAAHLPTDALDRMEIYRGPFTFRYGPAFGGVLHLVEDAFPSGGDVPPFQSSALVGYDSAVNGMNASARAAFGNERLRAAVNGAYASGGDYQSGDGADVPAGFNRNDASVQFQFLPSEGHAFRLDYHRAYAWGVDYPSLPMDMEKDLGQILSGSWSWSEPSAAVRHVDLKLFHSWVDHAMDNFSRASAAKVRSETLADTRTWGYRAEMEAGWDRGVLTVGQDLMVRAKDGTRTMDIQQGPMAGQTLEDIIWPDALWADAGAYAEYRGRITDSWGFMGAARFDAVRSDASHPDARFVALYGDDLERDDASVSLSAGVHWTPSAGDEAHLSVGSGVRSPNITERYLYLLPVGTDRYDYLGDPGLEPEANRQVEAGGSVRAARWSLRGSLFHAAMSDYITAAVVPGMPPRSPDVLGVKRFVNIPDAARTGGELSLSWGLDLPVRVTATAAYVEGRDRTNDDALPETPPLEGNLFVRFQPGSWWVEAHIRAVDRQDAVSVLFAEPVTPGYALYNLYGGFSLGAGSVVLELRNVTDKAYADHLNRRQLDTGARILEPGRSVSVSYRRSFR